MNKLEKEELEAQEYLEWLAISSWNNIIKESKVVSQYKDSYKYEEFDQYMLDKNQKIIEIADDCLFERLRNNDSTIKSSDLINLKETAFKQIRSIKGIDDWENKNLIPSVINIQVINNY